MTDIDIYNIIDQVCKLPVVLNECIIEYLGICMFCQNDQYPIHKTKINKIYLETSDNKIKYNICIDCIWTHLSCSISLSGEFKMIYSKYMYEKDCKCLRCDKIFGLTNIKKHISTPSHLSLTLDTKTKIKCWCGGLFNDGLLIKEHKKEYIHKRGYDIFHTFVNISVSNKKKTLELLISSAIQFATYIKNNNNLDTQKLDCLYKFTKYLKSKK